jgi:hypothetical protein
MTMIATALTSAMMMIVQKFCNDDEDEDVTPVMGCVLVTAKQEVRRARPCICRCGISVR